MHLPRRRHARLFFFVLLCSFALAGFCSLALSLLLGAGSEPALFALVLVGAVRGDGQRAQLPPPGHAIRDCNASDVGFVQLGVFSAKVGEGVRELVRDDCWKRFVPEGRHVIVGGVLL